MDKDEPQVFDLDALLDFIRTPTIAAGTPAGSGTLPDPRLVADRLTAESRAFIDAVASAMTGPAGVDDASSAGTVPGASAMPDGARKRAPGDDAFTARLMAVFDCGALDRRPCLAPIRDGHRGVSVQATTERTQDRKAGLPRGPRLAGTRRTYAAPGVSGPSLSTPW